MTDGWIKYSGTGNPVPLGSEIEVKLHSRDGEVQAGDYCVKIILYLVSWL